MDVDRAGVLEALDILSYLRMDLNSVEWRITHPDQGHDPLLPLESAQVYIDRIRRMLDV